VSVSRMGGRLALANAAGLLAGYALDLLLGDPPRRHPVAGYGRLATALERRCYAPQRAAGVRYVALAVGGPVALATLAQAATRRRPLVRAGLVAATTWAVVGGRSLRREAAAMASALESADLSGARARLPHLCGRDPSQLDAAELARATVESVAENTSDAVVAPLFWGHRSPRYARFGTAAARLDDAANLLPSRLTAALTVTAAPMVSGDRRRAARTWLRDGHRHPSPNAGQCESAMAGALGVRLGGRNVYSGRVEVRPFLGDGPRPSVSDIRRAAALSAAVGLGALGLAAGCAAAGRLSGAAGLRTLGLVAGCAATAELWARALPLARRSRSRRCAV